MLHIVLWLEVFHVEMHNGEYCLLVFAFSYELVDEEVASCYYKAHIYGILWHNLVILQWRLLQIMERKTSLEYILFESLHPLMPVAMALVGTTKIIMVYGNEISVFPIDLVIFNLYIHAKVAAFLVIICNYIVCHPACTVDWIIINVTPTINEISSNVLAALFEQTLLWFALSKNNSEHMLQDMCNQIVDACESIKMIGDSKHPVEC